MGFSGGLFPVGAGGKQRPTRDVDSEMVVLIIPPAPIPYLHHHLAKQWLGDDKSHHPDPPRRSCAGGRVHSPALEIQGGPVHVPVYPSYRVVDVPSIFSGVDINRDFYTVIERLVGENETMPDIKDHNDDVAPHPETPWAHGQDDQSCPRCTGRAVASSGAGRGTIWCAHHIFPARTIVGRLADPRV